MLMLFVSVTGAKAGSITSISARNSSVVLPKGGNNNSAAPVITPDGRFVVFVSSATDLVPANGNASALNVFLRDRSTKTTTLVSVNANGAGGGNDNSLYAQVSSNGQYVAFQSDATDLVDGDTNGVSDIFVRDVLNGTNILVSVSTNGVPANGASTEPAITPDGRYVVFVSAASDMVANDNNGIPDIFVRDLVNNTTTLVSVGANTAGALSGAPVISPDGRFVAFWSTSRGLAAGLPLISHGEVFVRDLQALATTWASTNASGILLATLGPGSTNASYHPRLSSDGRYVAFKTGSTNSGGRALILRHDITANTTLLLSSNGIAAVFDEDDAFGPEMNYAGQYVAYVEAEALAPGADFPYSTTSVRVWSAITGSTSVASGIQNSSPTNTIAKAPVIDGGVYVFFLSNATNLVSNAVSNGFHIYRSGLGVSGAAELVDVDTNGVASTDNELTSLSVSSRGQFAAFSSPDGSLTALDRNQALDIFVRDLLHRSNELISKRDSTLTPQTGDKSICSQISMSANGRWVTYASFADDLVLNDTNNQPDVFVTDLLTGTTVLASAGMDGGPALGGASGSPVLSGNGRYVAFVSCATNLYALGSNSFNLYLRDLQDNTTALVTKTTDTNVVAGASGGYVMDPVISEDGRYLAYWSSDVGLQPPGQGATYWRDMQRQTNMLLGRLSTEFAPSMSRDGRYVAYFGQPLLPLNQARTLYVRDTQAERDVYTSTSISSSSALGAVLSPDGKLLAYRGFYGPNPNVLFVDDVATGINIFSAKSSRPIEGSQPWSADGRFLAFVSTTNPGVGDNGVNKLLIFDAVSKSFTVANTNIGADGSVGSWFDLPNVSSDGRFVAYRVATNSFPWITNPPPIDLVYDRLTGSNSLLAVYQPGSTPFWWVSRPVISGSGATIAFSSIGSGFVSGDFNNAQDAFALSPDIGAPLDSDGDGIPDWWTTLYFGHATGQAADKSRPQDDADADGMSNLQEWLAGTDPTDASSRLYLASATLGQSGLTLSWQSVSGVKYYVQRAVKLSASPAFTTIETNIAGQQGLTTYSDTNAIISSALFYRVGVEVQ